MGANLRSVRELMMALLEEPLLSVDETAILLSLSRHSAYEAIKAGEIPSIRIGRCIKVPCSGLRTMLGIARLEPAQDRARQELPEKPRLSEPLQRDQQRAATPRREKEEA